MKEVVVAGGSGLIGNTLIGLLLKSRDVGKVIALVRKPLGWTSEKYKEIIIDFERLNDYSNELNADAFYCCLGTTRKKTPDKNEYRTIDHDYPIELAKIAVKNGVEQYHIVTALGSNKDSSLFYNRIKGETEEDLMALGLKGLAIYQPSLLVGQRKEIRLLEKGFMTFMKFINPVLKGHLKQYRSIEAETVAKAMVNQTLKGFSGTHIYPSDVIKELA